MKRERIERFVQEELDAERIRYGGTWLGREVWIPIWDEPPCIGPPVFALVRGESIRLTDPDEGFDVLDWLIKGRRLRRRLQTSLPSDLGLTP